MHLLWIFQKIHKASWVYCANNAKFSWLAKIFSASQVLLNNYSKNLETSQKKKAKVCGGHVRSFSSKRGHVTEKHILNGRKRDKLGNQTSEVLQLLKRTVYTIPFTYFT